MWRRIWSILLTAAVALSLTGTVLAADPTTMEDENFIYEIDPDNNDSIRVKEYKEEKRNDRNQTSVTIPGIYDGKLVTSIGEYAFGGENDTDPKSEWLEFITIPNSVNKIASHAFTGASALDSIEIPGGVVIADSAFERTENVRTIVIHDDVNDRGEIDYRSAKIGQGAFKDCKNLQKVVLPSSILTISEDAFSGCSELKEIVIPYSVQTIEKNAFAGCDSLRSLIFCRKEVTFGTTTNPVYVRAVFPTLKNISYIHCIDDSPIYEKMLAAVTNELSDPEEAAKRVHPIQMSPEQEKPTGMSEPRCKNPGTNGTITTKFTCKGYDVTTKTEVKKDDGTTETVTTTNHVDCECDSFKNSAHAYTIERKVSAADHKLEKMKDEPSTCVEHGYTNITKCSVCGTMLSSTELPLADHTYIDSDKTVKRTLFGGSCAEDSADATKGLILITARCKDCDYTPVCWECQKLEWELAKANAELEAAQKDYDEATADLKKAEEALKAAEEAQKAAEEALTKASEKVIAANEAHKEAAGKAAAAKAAYDALAETATDEEKAEAKKALDDANAAADQAADALIDAKLAEQDAKKVKDAADDAKDTAKSNRDTAKAEADKVPSDKVKAAKEEVSKKKEELTNHAIKNAAGSHEECPECNELRKAVDAATGANKEKAEQAYEDHLTDSNAHTSLTDITSAIKGEVTDSPAHQWGEDIEEVTIPAICGSTELGEKVIKHICEICGAEEVKETIPIRPAKEHTLDPNAKFKVIKEANCTEAGLIEYEPGVKCVVCGTEIKDSSLLTVTTSALDHDWVTAENEVLKEATCTEPGQIKTGIQTCQRENCPLKTEDGPYTNPESGKIEEIPALGHEWDDFQQEKVTKEPTCAPGEAVGTATCKRCGEEETITITLDPIADHKWGEWTPKGDGTEVRKCTVCGEEQTRTSTTPVDPGEPDDPDKPDPPKPEDETYTITVVQPSNGTVTASKSTAKKGESIIFTVTPSSGYETDMIRVIGGGVTAVTYTPLGGGQYRFTMPAANVEIRVSFSRLAPDYPFYWTDGTDSSSGNARRTTDTIPTQNPALSVPQAGASAQLFYDVPYGYWASGEIAWAYQMGYMTGLNGRFVPDGNISYQQLWMVLARLNGTYPASMEEARRWAVENGFADGSSPTGSVPRHYVITALYRCARLTGSSNQYTTSLAGYTDSRRVPANGREAMGWAVANGIVTGDSAKRLNPTATVTRVQFAVILYRFSQRV